ncbi:MAG: hypothetical protein QW561_01570 [Candidatus Aenigmatarchaeota archaeon]
MRRGKFVGVWIEEDILEEMRKMAEAMDSNQSHIIRLSIKEGLPVIRERVKAFKHEKEQAQSKFSTARR